VPFTLLFIAPVNNKLIEKKNLMRSASLTDKKVEADVAESETTHALIDKWATLNLARAVLIGAGALCAVIAAVDKRQNFRFGSIGLSPGASRM
jgi:DMSO reductase anchor subunit